MSAPKDDALTAAVAEHGPFPMPVGTKPVPMRPEQRKAIAVQIGEVQPATDALIGSLAESVANVRNHEHPSWEDLYCMNLTSYMGERMASVLKRLLDTETENARLGAENDTLGNDLTGANLAQWEDGREIDRLRLALKAVQRGRRELRARVAELEGQRDRRRVRLVALQNDALSMRGSLAPNGEDRKVPFELGQTLTPAVDWLINRVAELENDSKLLAALYAAGVDNWEGYDIAREGVES
ncbi:hypothetical protein ACIGZI_01245 [Streptomyces griseus]|uniref:hypothetical protein n=1 Tax=Streptomyces griseus TaxID=1911 RepID=UPI0037CDB57B